MSDKETQAIYDELNRRGVFKSDPEAIAIGHELRRRHAVTDPTQGGAVKIAPAPAAPTLTPALAQTLGITPANIAAVQHPAPKPAPTYRNVAPRKLSKAQRKAEAARDVARGAAELGVPVEAARRLGTGPATQLHQMLGQAAQLRSAYGQGIPHALKSVARQNLAEPAVNAIMGKGTSEQIAQQKGFRAGLIQGLMGFASPESAVYGLAAEPLGLLGPLGRAAGAGAFGIPAARGAYQRYKAHDPGGALGGLTAFFAPMAGAHFLGKARGEAVERPTTPKAEEAPAPKPVRPKRSGTSSERLSQAAREAEVRLTPKEKKSETGKGREVEAEAVPRVSQEAGGNKTKKPVGTRPTKETGRSATTSARTEPESRPVETPAEPEILAPEQPKPAQKPVIPEPQKPAEAPNPAGEGKATPAKEKAVGTAPRGKKTEPKAKGLISKPFPPVPPEEMRIPQSQANIKAETRSGAVARENLRLQQERRQAVPEKVPSLEDEREVYRSSAVKEKPHQRTGLTSSQERFLSKQLDEVAQGGSDKPVRIQVPRDGEFTVNAEQAKALKSSMKLDKAPATPKPASRGAKRGAITIGPGKPGSPQAKTAEAISSLAKQAREGLAPIKRAVSVTFNPAGTTEEAGQTARIMRERIAQLQRKREIAHEALKELEGHFEGLSEKEQMAFQMNMDTGKSQGNPHLDTAAKALRSILDAKRDEVRALGTGKLDVYHDNYFPRRFKPKGEKEPAGGNIETRAYTRRPLAGTKTALKARTFATLKEALDAGHVPEYTNPVTMVKAHLYDMDRYILATKVMQEMKDRGLLRFVKAGLAKPGGEVTPHTTKKGELISGYRTVDDAAFTVYAPRTSEGAVAIRGHYAAPEDAARVLNNFLNPGLRGSSFYDIPAAWGNNLNMAQLGLSLYHATFTGINSVLSKQAVQLQAISRGDFSTLGKTLSPRNATLIQGDRMLREILRPGSVGGDIPALVDAFEAGGGRARLDSFYRGASADFMKAFRQRQGLRMAQKAVPALFEAAAYPVMQMFVPRAKLGAFADLARLELERLGKEGKAGDRDAMREAMGRAWDSIDNRFGQLTYDNLFWSRTLKDLTQLSIRSVGWQIGSGREFGGAAIDLYNVKGKFQRKEPLLTPRMAYTLSTVTSVGLMGAIYGYMNGHPPQELKDYFYPKGADGKRIVFPTYMRDAMTAKTAADAAMHLDMKPATQTVLNKLNPAPQEVWEMLTNQDFYGDPIHNTQDSRVQQMKDIGAYMIGQYTPLSLRRRYGQASSVSQLLGIMPAPQELGTQSEQERKQGLKLLRQSRQDSGGTGSLSYKSLTK